MIVLEFFIAIHEYAEALRDNLYPVAGKVEEHRQQCPHVQGDIEIQPFQLPPEKPRGQIQVGGTRYRQKLGQALDHRQDNHLQ